MTSIGTRSEPKPGGAGQEVLWLSASEPPPQLATFLRSRGLSLVTREEQRSAAPLKLRMIEAGSSPATRAPLLGGRRLAVMHPDPGTADALAQALRAKGAEVVALSLNPGALARAEQLDPDAVIMESSDFCGSCWEIVRALFQHPQLRFATVVLAAPELMGHQQMSALDVHDLSFALSELAGDYQRIAEQAKTQARFSFELASLGPFRSLRALLESGRRLRVLLGAGVDSVEIDLAEQIIVGAQSPAGAPPTEGLLGVHALHLFLSRCVGKVEVRSVEHPVHTNVMAPLDTALHLARDASSGTRPSGVHRPVLGQGAPEAVQAEVRKAPPLHQRTLIGVPAVRLEPAAKSAAEKPGAAGKPSAEKSSAAQASGADKASSAKPAESDRSSKAEQAATGPERASGADKSEPQIPASNAPVGQPRASMPTRPSKPGSARAGATVSYATPQAPAHITRAPEPAPPPAHARGLSAPPALPFSATMVMPVVGADAVAPGAEAEAALPLSVELEPLEPASAQTSSLAPPPLRSRAPAAAPDKPLDFADAEAVRSMRARLSPAVVRRASGVAAACAVLFVTLWLFTRPSAPPEVAAAPLAPLPVPSLSTKAMAQPPPAPAASAVAEVAEPREAGEAAEVSQQNRANARKAGQLANQGNAFRRKRMLPSARARYLEALRVYPAYPRALSGLAQLALAAGHGDEAREYAEQLVKARPGQAAYQLLLGDALRAAGDEKAARAAYQTAERLGSRSAAERLEKK